MHDVFSHGLGSSSLCVLHDFEYSILHQINETWVDDRNHHGEEYFKANITEPFPINILVYDSSKEVPSIELIDKFYKDFTV
jgi:hypothetical protein